MASVREKFSTTGRRYFEIRVSRGRGQSALSRNWYPDENWSENYVQRELVKAASEFERQVQAGEVVSRKERLAKEAAAALERSKVKSYRQYVNEIYMPRKELHLKPSSIHTYRYFFETVIFPAIGDIPMSDITTSMLTKLLTDYQASNKTARTAQVPYALLKTSFNDAYMEDTITHNPMLKVRRPLPSKEELANRIELRRSLTTEQVDAIKAYMQNQPLMWNALITLALDTGARRAELCGLRWTDIDFKQGLVHFENNIIVGKDGAATESTLKTGRDRTVDIGQNTLLLLRQLKKEQSEHCLSRYVFTNGNTSEVIHLQSVNWYVRALGKKLGIPRLHPHTFRHTAATEGAEHATNIHAVAARLGHSDPAMTLRNYVHSDMESIRRAGEATRSAMGL